MACLCTFVGSVRRTHLYPCQNRYRRRQFQSRNSHTYIGGIGSCLGNSIRYRCPKRTWRDKQKELDVSHPFGLGYRLFMAMLLQGIAGG